MLLQESPEEARNYNVKTESKRGYGSWYPKTEDAKEIADPRGKPKLTAILLILLGFFSIA